MSPEQTQRTIFVGATLVVYFVANVLISWRKGGWKPLTIVIAAILASELVYAWYFRDLALAYYVLFGVVAGFGELPTDAWLVKASDTLIYPRDEPMIWASPAYMPFAWAVVLVQVAVLGDALVPVMHVGLATLLVAVLAGAYIPVFEHLAKQANLWWYKNTPMLYNAPYYVILAEFLLGLPLVWMGLSAENDPFSARSIARIVGYGIIEGLIVMFVAVLIAFRLVGKGKPEPSDVAAA